MIARILLYIILLLIIPAALYFLFTSALFVTLPFSRQKIQEERQEQVYKTALTKEYLSTKEEISNLFEEAKKFKYKFTEGSGLVLVDIMRLLWPEEKDLRYGIRLTPMAKPTEWIFPNQTNTEAIIIHHTFACSKLQERTLYTRRPMLLLGQVSKQLMCLWGLTTVCLMQGPLTSRH